MTVHVLLPVHNRVEITRRFVRQLRAQQGVASHLVLIDDGCTDGTVDAVEAEWGRDQRLTILRGDGSLWWAGALQLAYRHLQAHPPAPEDSILIINDDVEIDPDFLACGSELLTRDPTAAWQATGVDGASGRVDRGVVSDLHRLTFRDARAGEQPNCLSTRGLIMTSSTFMSSGGFRPGWLPHYLSDYEFTLRLGQLGARLACDDRFRIRTDSTLTGDADYLEGSVSQVLRSALSFRSKRNPKHWSAFALMACPAPTGLLHAVKIWARFSLTLLRAARGSVKRESR